MKIVKQGLNWIEWCNF